MNDIEDRLDRIESAIDDLTWAVNELLERTCQKNSDKMLNSLKDMIMKNPIIASNPVIMNVFNGILGE